MQAARTHATSALRTLSRAAPAAHARPACSETLASTSAARAFSLSASSRAPEAAPSSSSSSPSSSSPSSPSPASGPGTHFFSPTPSSQLSFLRGLLPGSVTPNADLLDEQLAAKALTHKSGVDKRAVYGRGGREGEQGEAKGKTGHNEKLAFIGRRVLRLHLTTHLLTSLTPSSPALLSSSLSSSSLDSLLDTKTLGASVGKAWKLEDGLRWREVRGRDGEMTGLWKCRGVAVEAVVGAVYTTQGLNASTALFESLVLPHLPLPRTLASALSSTGSSPSLSSSSPIVDDVPRPSVQEAVQA
ncbi:hypothetical protein JCM6882_005428 [Rhodosporidiobolus microsporus]